MPVRLPEGTVLTIQAWGLPRARTLKARVVQAKKVDALWFTGCELPTRLTDVELVTKVAETPSGKLPKVKLPRPLALVKWINSNVPAASAEPVTFMVAMPLAVTLVAKIGAVVGFSGVLVH